MNKIGGRFACAGIHQVGDVRRRSSPMMTPFYVETQLDLLAKYDSFLRPVSEPIYERPRPRQEDVLFPVLPAATVSSPSQEGRTLDYLPGLWFKQHRSDSLGAVSKRKWYRLLLPIGTVGTE
jgi:hypothetical protein